MTLNFQNVVTKNPAIGEEFGRTGRLINDSAEIPLFMLRKKSPEQKAKDKSLARYESRKNSCPSCNLAMPATGVCDECD